MDMITIDIGNTTISMAVYDDNKLNRIETVPLSEADGRTLGDILAAFRDICGEQEHGAHTVPVVASSVNPGGLEMVERAVNDSLHQQLLVVGRDFPLEMKVSATDYESIGSDRLINAFAAYAVIEKAAVIADFGTATTIDCVNDQGIFLGGVIMPGMKLSSRALNENTAALPDVDIVVPDSTFGIDTPSSIQNGIYYGALGALREVVERFAEELGHWPQVVLTGGFSKMIAEKCEYAESLVPNLCMDGLYLAYCRYRESLEQGVDIDEMNEE